jgi:hypothetical protein
MDKEYPLLYERGSGKLAGREGRAMKLGAVVGKPIGPNGLHDVETVAAWLG